MKALQDFIRVYNEILHSTTKVAPAMLMLRMQAEYDSRMRAKECTKAAGCKVLMEQERVNKSNIQTT